MTLNLSLRFMRGESTRLIPVGYSGGMETLRRQCAQFVDEFPDYVRRCFRRAQLPKWWGKFVNGFTLILGWGLVWLISAHPEWTNLKQAWYAFWFVLVLPVSLATIAVLWRLIIAPYLVQRDIDSEHACKVLEIESERDVLQDRIDDLTNVKKLQCEQAIQACFEEYVSIHRGKPALPIESLLLTHAHKLASNEDVLEVCRRIEKYQQGNPLNYLRGYVMPEETLEFLCSIVWGLTGPVRSVQGIGELHIAMNDWRIAHGHPEPPLDQRLRSIFDRAAEP